MTVSVKIEVGNFEKMGVMVHQVDRDHLGDRFGTLPTRVGPGKSGVFHVWDEQSLLIIDERVRGI